MLSRLDSIRNQNYTTNNVTSQEKRAAQTFDKYIEERLVRGFFEQYNSSNNELSIMSENPIDGSKISESFSLTPQQSVLCWPETITLTNRDGTQEDKHLSTAYIPVEEDKGLQLFQQSNTQFSEVLPALSEDSYIFIHLGNDNRIKQVAITGCL
jgi:hypothetical protein